MSIASISSMAPLRRSFEAALPGLALSLFVAMSAYWSSPWTAAATKAALGHEVRIMPTVLALIMGAALHPLTVNLPVRPGLTFAVKRFLRWAIALYGLNVTIVDILSLGWSTPLMVISAMTVTIVSTMAFAAAGRSAARAIRPFSTRAQSAPAAPDLRSATSAFSVPSDRP